MNFTYHGVDLAGFDHQYNQTARNERAVELAVAAHWLPDGGDVLEVGNVLAHYGIGPQRRVVDLNERAPGVENIDVFNIAGGYDTIVAISTIEHVGWDSPPRDPNAAKQAIAHLQALLKSAGRMLITVPAGYHPPLDAHLKTGAGTTRDCTIARTSTGWAQTKIRTFKPYGATTPWAESVWIGEWGTP